MALFTSCALETNKVLKIIDDFVVTRWKAIVHHTPLCSNKNQIELWATTARTPVSNAIKTNRNDERGERIEIIAITGGDNYTGFVLLISIDVVCMRCGQ